MALSFSEDLAKASGNWHQLQVFHWIISAMYLLPQDIGGTAMILFTLCVCVCVCESVCTLVVVFTVKGCKGGDETR